MTVHTEQTRPGPDWAGWGMNAPPEPPADDDEPEMVREVSGLGASTPDSAQVVRVTFVDSFGRQCTQVTVGNAVAVDCDYKPVESRLGSLLEGPGQ
jgi:hypothetical protein